MDLEGEMRSELAHLAANSRLRSTAPLGGPDRLHPTTAGGERLLSFSTNDYLGLANHPDLTAAALEATRLCGFGSGASRLVSGETPSHRALERTLADYLQTGDALLFPTGYQTNVGVLTALAGPDDLIVSDSANHASIIDGCRLSRARVSIYRHCDALGAEAALKVSGTFRRRLLITESLFSMDGDRAPLKELAAAAEGAGAALIVDEAHALGVVGPQGRGLAAALGVRPDALIGTLGKAFGSLGGFCAGSTTLRALLINRARQFIYSTAPPSSVAAAAQAGVLLSASASGDERRTRAYAAASRARTGLRQLGLTAPGEDLIVPLVVGSDATALTLSAALLARNILAPAIRPPTVAPGTSRLRLTFSGGHTAVDIDHLLEAIAAARPQIR